MVLNVNTYFFFFSSRRRHTRCGRDWSSDVCSSDLMVSRARRIGEANLADRLPHPGTADEIGRLVETLNEMLERLERSFEVRRMFSADASHELRSPVSRLRAELEVALRRPRQAAEYEETLRSCLDEVERVQGMIEELLELAH